MKKIVIISGVLAAGIMMVSCRNGKRDTGKAYMPDMAYSRAYETYAALDSTVFTNEASKAGAKIYYDRMPVAGTIARGDMPAYPYKNDSTGYANSKDVVNPLPALDAKDYLEAARLFLVNCAICHGDKLDGNGPLYKDGNGPFSAKPANLSGSDSKYVTMAQGTMFHSVTYGIRAMGSYASQLSTKQRWMIIHYIKEKQAASSGTTKPATDSAAVKK